MGSRDYQYGTSPRKLEPEYEPRKKKKKSNAAAKAKKKAELEKEKKRQARKNRFLIGLNCILIIGTLFVIILRNSLITQTFAQIQILKSEIAEIQKENDQLEISIQNNLNLSNIEQEAREQLGMQKLTSKQTIYLNLPKKDYVEPSTEEVLIEESDGFFKSIVEFFKDMF